MRLSVATLAGCIAAAQAFRDTSPFLLFSSSSSDSIQAASKNQLQSSKNVLTTTKQFLKDCPSEVYYIVHQPSLLSSDLNTDSAVALRTALSAPSIQSKYLIRDVEGLDVSVKSDLLSYITQKCGGEDKVAFIDEDASIKTDDTLESKISGQVSLGKKVVVVKTMEELSSGSNIDRAVEFKLIDQRLQYHLQPISYPSSSGLKLPYTIIYTSTPPSIPVSEETEKEKVYEAKFQESAKMGLKLDLRADSDKYPWPGNDTDSRPLFEKYQFFTPGIFMGGVVILILVSILSVGLKAISGLQVSYGAFDKENGPNAQKKG